jgi:hypothetical protein
LSQTKSTSFYCRLLAWFDLSVVFTMSRDIYYLVHNVDPILISLVYCRIFLYFSNSLGAITGWLIVVFSLDQLSRVTQVEHLRFVEKKPFRYLIVSTVIMAHFAIYLIYPIFIQTTYVSLDNNTNVTFPNCDATSISFHKSLSIFTILDQSLIPFGLMVAFSLVTIWKLFESRRMLEVRTSEILPDRRIKDRNFAISSIMICFVFIVLQIGVPLVRILTFSDFFLYKACLNISYTIYNINFSTRFIIYMTSNSVFRKEYFELIRPTRDYEF